MGPSRRLSRATTLVTCLMLCTCDRPETRTAADARPGVATAVDSIAPVADSTAGGWEVAVGDVLVLPGDDGPLNGALLRVSANDQTLADTTGLGVALGDARLDLFARHGSVGTARVRVQGPPRVDVGCTAWPVARLSTEAGAAVRPWTVAFLAGRIDPIALDSIEALTPRDSATLAAQIARVASRLPDDTNPTFRARPYVVQRAWIGRTTDAPLAVALLIRRVNQEDAPREERLVLVLDRSGDAPSDAWRVGWHERASGTEEELVVAEPLLAYRVRGGGGGDPHLFFGRDDGYALSATVLVRRDGRWQVLWESAIAGCS